MKRNGIFHWSLMFCLMYFIFLLKFIGLSIYGYYKYNLWYWFDDAFWETFKVSAIAFIAVFIRAKIHLWIEKHRSDKR